MIEQQNKFPGFSYPEKNWYQFPKDLNGYMSQLSGNEYKVLSYIVRKTWGFNKVEDKISYKQFLKGMINSDGIKIFDGLGISDETLRKCLNTLKEKKFIEIIKKEGYISIYKLKYNQIPTPPKKTIPPPPRKPQGTPPRKPYIQYKNTIINNNTVGKTNNEPFLFKEKLVKMEQSKQRQINIIALYWKFKHIEPENNAQYQSLLKRELKPAKSLIGWNNKQILEIMTYLENNETFKWTLESVLKYIQENLKRIKPIK